MVALIWVDIWPAGYENLVLPDARYLAGFPAYNLNVFQNMK
jgi:hypothetical protein